MVESMRMLQIYNIIRILITCCFLGYSTWTYSANININFNGFIKPGSCEVDLDQPSLNLGDIDYFTLKSGNALLNVTKFNVSVHDCFLSADTILSPVIQIDGEGFNANGKFIFRGSDSTTKGVGILLYKGIDSPQYNDISLKPGDYIELGVSGSVPADTIIPFNVGVSCGSISDCNTSDINPGKMISRIIFNFRYY